MENKNINNLTKDKVCKRYVPLPIGYKYTACPKCGGTHLTGALLTEFADEQDPDILCKDCGTRVDEEVVY